MSNILNKSILDTQDYNDSESVLYKGVLKSNVLETKDKDSKTKDIPRIEAEVLVYRTDPEFLKAYTYGEIDPITEEEIFYPPAARMSMLCVVYTDYSKYYNDVYWLQTIKTDYREIYQKEEFIDRNVDEPDVYYDQSEDVKNDIEIGFSKENLSLYYVHSKYRFSDFPSRPADRDFFFEATLSLVGVNSDGTLDRITTIRWGYTYNKKKDSLNLKPKKIEFEPKRISNFHLDVIKNPQKYRK